MADGTHVILGAEASKTVQALMGTYGFDLERSVEAVQALGDSCGDVGLAVDWLLAHGEEDKGGAVEFAHCPHLTTSQGPGPAGQSRASVAGRGRPWPRRPRLTWVAGRSSRRRARLWPAVCPRLHLAVRTGSASSAA